MDNVFHALDIYIVSPTTISNLTKPPKMQHESE